jgi:hypothetical protein
MSARIVEMIEGAGTAHTNSTDEASLARKAFAADELSKGKIYKFFGAFRATATNSTDTLTPRIRFGTSGTVTSNTEIGVGSAVDVANDDTFIVDGYLHVQSATRAVFHGLISDCDADGSKLLNSFYQVFTIAAGTAYNLDITADWSVANAGNSVQAEAFGVIELF